MTPGPFWPPCGTMDLRILFGNAAYPIPAPVIIVNDEYMALKKRLAEINTMSMTMQKLCSRDVLDALPEVFDAMQVAVKTNKSRNVARAKIKVWELNGWCKKLPGPPPFWYERV